MWNFLVSLVLTLEFPRDLTQFCGISKGLSFVLSGISRGNVKKEKFQGGGVKKVYPNPPHPQFGFFLEQPIQLRQEDLLEVVSPNIQKEYRVWRIFTSRKINLVLMHEIKQYFLPQNKFIRDEYLVGIITGNGHCEYPPLFVLM